MFLPPRGAHADPLLLVPALAEAKATRITLTPSLLASLLRIFDAEPLLPDLHVRLADTIFGPGSLVMSTRVSVLDLPCPELGTLPGASLNRASTEQGKLTLLNPQHFNLLPLRSGRENHVKRVVH